MSPARRWIRNDVVFAGLVLCLLALTYTPLADPINEPLCAVSYRGATWLLHAVGVPFTAIEAHRTLVHFPFAIEVTGLCSGLRGLALFAAAIALLPLSRRQKALHFALGALILVLVNIARVAHLFALGAGGSPRFALYHEWLWPAAIVGLILLYRLVMLVVTWRRPAEVAHA
jgi:exosortase/archaeosortase family protein